LGGDGYGEGEWDGGERTQTRRDTRSARISASLIEGCSGGFDIVRVARGFGGFVKGCGVGGVWLVVEQRWGGQLLDAAFRRRADFASGYSRDFGAGAQRLVLTTLLVCFNSEFSIVLVFFFV
jgi:hypothetical protein